MIPVLPGVRDDIEFTRRLLEETRTAANLLAAEHAALETRIDKLTNKRNVTSRAQVLGRS